MREQKRDIDGIVEIHSFGETARHGGLRAMDTERSTPERATEPSLSPSTRTSVAHAEGAAPTHPPAHTVPSSSVAPRLFARVGTALALVFATLGVVAVTGDYRARMESLETRAETITRLIAASVNEAQAVGGRLAIRDVERTAASYPEHVYTVFFDAAGEVVMAHGVPFVSDAGAGYIVGGLDEASAIRIEVGQAMTVERRSGLVEMREKTPDGGMLVVGFTTAAVKDSVRTSAAFILLGLVLALALVSVVTWRAVSREIARPVDAIMEGADAVARGDLTYRIAVDGDDELSRLARSFNAMTEELDGARRQQRTFFSSIGHELRSPVNAIRGFVDVVLSGDDTLTVRTRGNLSRVQSSADRLLHLVNDMLDLAKLEAARLEVHPEEVAVQDIVVELADQARALAGGRAVSVVHEVSPESLRMFTDGGRLRQILLNLAANAVRFTPSGTVTLRAAADGADGVVFTVKDEGIGIAPEHHQMIFEAFRQVDDDDGARAGGTGLGLAIVRQLTELLDGTVTLESERHAGTTFTLRFPRVFVADKSSSSSSMV